MRSKEFITLGTTFVVLALIFSSDRLIGYSSIVAGTLLSIFNAIQSRRKLKVTSHQAGGAMR